MAGKSAVTLHRDRLEMSDGARVIAQRYLDGGSRLDAIAPAGSTIVEIVGIALPGATESFLPHVRVTIGEDVIPREMWARIRPKPAAARSIAATANPSSEFVEGVRKLYGSNLSMFIRLGFDPKSAKFLAVMLAAHMINDELGRRHGMPTPREVMLIRKLDAVSLRLINAKNAPRKRVALTDSRGLEDMFGALNARVAEKLNR
jgi:hypothetical protein